MSANNNGTGAPEGNRNAKTHGAYQTLALQKIDGRTREARAVAQIEAELSAALGGDPSPQQILLVQRCAIKAVRCALAEVAILRGSASQTLSDDWLKWSQSLRADLVALGLERRAATVTDLKSYVRGKYGAK